MIDDPDDFDLLEDVEMIDGDSSAKRSSTAAPIPDEPRPSRQEIESEPVINLDDSFADEDIEDIIVFDDE
jgi:hypothetical protein